MVLSPMVRFSIALLTSITIAVSQGTLNLSGAIPADLIKPVTAWCGIIAFVSSAITAAAVGAGLTTASRIASAAEVTGVKRIDVTPDVAAVVTDATRKDAQIVTVPGVQIVTVPGEPKP